MSWTLHNNLQLNKILLVQSLINDLVSYTEPAMHEAE